jgi:membrane dipeptidase
MNPLSSVMATGFARSVPLCARRSDRSIRQRRGQRCARALWRGVLSNEALQIARDAEIVDLHLDTFIAMRLFGWDLTKRHDVGPLRGNFFGHVDLPRIQEGGLKGAMWSITTNPFRSAAGRWRTFSENLERLKTKIERTDGLGIACTHSDYLAVRRSGAHACLLSVQGGNCFDAAPSLPERLITRVTLVHLLDSAIGATSTPIPRWRAQTGLSEKGRALVQELDRLRIFVDLAHIHPDGFWEAVEVHDRGLPLIATHTGVSGATPHWRNLDDRQLRAIADSGGVAGIIFSANFLRPGGVLGHMQHVIDTVGEDFVAIGSDYDGAITPPRELRDGAAAYPTLIQQMLDRRWSIERIEKVLAKNFLRAFAALRP